MKAILGTIIVMLVTFVLASGVCLWSLRGIAPPFNWGIAVAIYGAFSVYLSVRTWRLASGRTTLEAFRSDHLILDLPTIWFANLSIIGGHWLLFPWGTPELRSIYLILSMISTSGFMLCTIVRPPSRRFIFLAPSMISISNALFWSIFRESFWYIIIPINLALAIVLLLGKWQLQAIMQEAYQARIAAEATQTEVEAERDAKTRFLASASHDLGQPLQAARMFFDQAMRSESGETRDRAVRGVHWAFDASEQLLGQMMAHLQLESGTLTPKLEGLTLGPLIAEVTDMHEPAAGLAQVRLHAMPCGLRVEADPALLQRALGNFVGNAIRHAKARRILIGGRRSGARVRIWVIDDGLGVVAADIPRLFEDYVQGSDHGQQTRGGFGLGLSTTRRLARLMGGDAGLEAKWVNGSAFWLELPTK